MKCQFLLVLVFIVVLELGITEIAKEFKAVVVEAFEEAVCDCDYLIPTVTVNISS